MNLTQNEYGDRKIVLCLRKCQYDQQVKERPTFM